MVKEKEERMIEMYTPQRIPVCNVHGEWQVAETSLYILLVRGSWGLHVLILL